jgi:hypothetical protein
MTGRTSPSVSPSEGLDALRARVHAPEGGREDLDALLVEIDRPLADGENARHRAEQLRRIVADTWLAEFTGTDGRRANEAAAQALRTLDVSSTPDPPPARPFANLDEAEEATGSEGLSWRHVVGVLGLAMGVCEGGVLLETFSWGGVPLALGGTGPSVIMPALVLMRRPGAHNRFHYGLSASIAALSTLPWALVALVLMAFVEIFVLGRTTGGSFQAWGCAFVLGRLVLAGCLLSARHEEAPT